MIAILMTHWKAVLFAVLMAMAYITGFRNRGSIEAIHQAKAIQAQAAEYDAKIASLEKVNQSAADREEKTRTITKYVDREVIRYVQTHTDRVLLPPDWRMLHDTATGENTPAAGGTGQTSGPVDDSTALSTVTTNYAQCKIWRDEVVKWRDWYKVYAGKG